MFFQTLYPKKYFAFFSWSYLADFKKLIFPFKRKEKPAYYFWSSKPGYI